MINKNKEKLHVMHVFTENNNVYIKKNKPSSNNATTKQGEWFPIHFQWELI